jgi:hypothetical protein
MEESKVVSSRPFMVNFRHVPRALVLLSLLFSLAVISQAQAAFTLSAAQLQPTSVDPGGSATSILTLTTGPGFTGAVSFTCIVTSAQVTTDLPACAVSPLSETASSLPSLTITTSGSTLPGSYQVLVTGTDSSIPLTASVTLELNVADLAEDYTITIYPTTAIPSPIVAGDIATTTVTVAPIGGYTGTVTLSCLSVTPVVTGSPVCSFTPSPTVKVTPGTPPTTTLTLTTFTTVNNPPSSSIIRSHPHVFYAVWLLLPSLVFVGWGTTGKRRRKFLGMFLLMAIAAGLFLLPACGGNSNNAANQITPNNTYTFTLTGSDQKGLGPSSTSTATVMLEVNTPK